MKLIKNNFKIFIGFILGVILSGGIVYAVVSANQIEYTREGSNINNVEDALNDLYETKSKLILQTDATPSDILKNKKAYSNGELIVGTYEEPAYYFYINTFRGNASSNAGVSIYTSNYREYKYYRFSQTTTGTSSSVALTKYDWSKNAEQTSLSFDTKYEIINNSEEIFITPNTGYRLVKVEFFKE